MERRGATVYGFDDDAYAAQQRLRSASTRELARHVISEARSSSRGRLGSLAAPRRSSASPSRLDATRAAHQEALKLYAYEAVTTALDAMYGSPNGDAVEDDDEFAEPAHMRW